MSCYTVWAKESNKPIRTTFYEFTDSDDRKRALALATKVATDMHNAGTPCTVEQFHACDVGVTVFDTEAK